MKSTFAIHKLDCHSCAMMIEGICEDLPGVNKAEVKTRERRLVVEHQESLDPKTVAAALDQGGYPVTPESSAK